MNDHAHLVSVIIVNFNGGQFLTDCVQRVLASSTPVEVFIVDNASTDDSLQFLQQTLSTDKRLQIFHNTTNLGFAQAANLAIPATRGDYLLFLNPDCFIAPATLTRFCETMGCFPQAGMAGCLVLNPDGTEQPGCRRGIPSPWRSLVRVFHLDRLFPQHSKFKSFVLTNTPLPTEPIDIEGISGACMFVRRTALNEVGPMDETYFLHCEDLDWFMRFHAQGWQILFIPSIEVVHLKGICSRKHPVRVLWYKHRGMVRFYRKFFRHQYPVILLWLVTLAVWTRFAILLVTNLFRQRW